MKVAYNACYGGFSLSPKAIEVLETQGVTDVANLARHDPRLVSVVETLGKDAYCRYSRLCVCEIKGTRYRIHEYDGSESVITPEEDEASYTDASS